MKINRLASCRGCWHFHCSHRSATSGRSCSAARIVFFLNSISVCPTPSPPPTRSSRCPTVHAILESSHPAVTRPIAAVVPCRSSSPTSAASNTRCDSPPDASGGVSVCWLTCRPHKWDSTIGWLHVTRCLQPSSNHFRPCDRGFVAPNEPRNVAFCSYHLPHLQSCSVLDPVFAI